MASPIELLIRANAVGFAGVAKELGGLEKQFTSLQSVAAGALSFAGIGLGAAEIVQLADAYGQMVGKLKLATQYTGDFANVFEMLKDSAKDSRAGLEETVQTYAKLSNPLKAVGLSSREAVGFLTLVNKAIATSGNTAETSAAGLYQFGQGLASGRLSGDELRSVLENALPLAQAIADGLGISVGELRKWGEEGKLTAEVVTGAIQKMADQINDDFAKMPVTVGQAFTNLRNEFLVFVGATDQAAGGTTALASAINSIADEFKEAGPAVTAFTTLLKTMMAGIDGSYRLIKILGTGLAAYAAMATSALSGNFQGAKAIWKSLGDDIDAILQKPLTGQVKAIEATVDTARKRKQLEQQLADETIKLEKLKSYEAGTASDNVAAKDKANIDSRIADQKRLVDAVRAAWKDSLSEVEKYANAAKEKIQKATDFRDEGNKYAFSVGLNGASDEDKLAAKASRMTDLQGQGSYEAAKARMAALQGDIKKYDAAALVAEKRLKEALQLAQEIGDISSIESISNDLAKNQEAGAALDTKKAGEAKARGEDQAKLLNGLQQQLDDLETKARSLEVQVDITKAATAIKGLQAQLAEIQDKTITVTVQTVTGGAAPAEVPAFAGGGIIRGAGTGTSDSILARLSNGEGIIRNRAVAYYGENLVHRINSLQLPKFANGGIVGGSSQSSGSTVNLSIDGNRFAMNASAGVVDQIKAYVSREALRKGGRR